MSPLEQLSPLELAWLANQYQVVTPDPCRVCGEPVSIGRSGPDGVVYRCGSEQASFLGKDGEARRAAERHYSDSQQTIYNHGDARVLALIAEARARRVDAGEPAYPAAGELFCRTVPTADVALPGRGPFRVRARRRGGALVTSPGQASERARAEALARDTATRRALTIAGAVPAHRARRA